MWVSRSVLSVHKWTWVRGVAAASGVVSGVSRCDRLNESESPAAAAITRVLKLLGDLCGPALCPSASHTLLSLILSLYRLFCYCFHFSFLKAPNTRNRTPQCSLSRTAPACEPRAVHVHVTGSTLPVPWYSVMIPLKSPSARLRLPYGSFAT